MVRWGSIEIERGGLRVITVRRGEGRVGQIGRNRDSGVDVSSQGEGQGIGKVR
jgi:hypothetical protein